MTDAGGSIRRAAVLGAPIAHSLSPVLHRAAYAALGLDWHYEAMECPPQRLPDLLDGLDASYVGLSLTMPLKVAVLPLLDEVVGVAAEVGAVNTVLLGTPGRRVGHNTDVPGILAALYATGVTSVGDALVLGGGATATSALAALRELGVAEPAVMVRSPEHAAGLLAAAERLGVRPRLVPWSSSAQAELVVSTVPAGAADGVRPIADTVFDVVYNPWPTAFAEAARTSGARVVGGLGLLVEQAALQVELMTGLPAPVEAMRVAGEQALHA